VRLSANVVLRNVKIRYSYWVAIQIELFGLGIVGGEADGVVFDVGIEDFCEIVVTGREHKRHLAIVGVLHR
jgi:hypothetical protein